MNVALVLAGGAGTRLGAEIPKQYIEVLGKPIISYCMETLTSHEDIDAIYVVADEKWHKFIKDNVPFSKVRGFVVPGNSRQLSIYNGLEAMKGKVSDDDVVLIHDAARPMLSKELISACLSSIEGHDGVLPVIPMKDTLYMSENNKNISSLLDRNKIFAGQAPEAFVFGEYYKANKDLLPDDIMKINGSTEPAVIAGLDIIMISGDESNIKITTAEDLNIFKKSAEG